VAKLNYVINSFLGGEISPRAIGRSDLPQYRFACNTIKNFITMAFGGLIKRPGSQYLVGVSNNATKSRLFPYVPDDSTARVIEYNGTDGPQIINPDGTTETNVGAAPAFSVDKAQFAQRGTSLFMVEAGDEPHVFVEDIAGAGFGFEPYRQPGNNLAGDRGAAAWTPYRDQAFNPATVTLTPSATTGSITLTASAAFFDFSGQGHIGAYFLLNDGYVVITAIASTTSATATVGATLSATTATSDWYESSWSTFRGFPRTVTFYKGRLVFGGNISEPDTIWFSAIANNFRMSLDHDGVLGGTALAASDPGQFVLASQRSNFIQWMTGQNNLAIGTVGDEYTLSEGLDPTGAPDFKKQTSHGGRIRQPVQNANRVTFIEASRRVLREFVFNFDSDSYIAQNLTLFADHIFDDFNLEIASSGDAGFNNISFQESPYEVVWVTDDDGGLSGITRDTTQNIAAWHRHRLGGVSDTSSNPPKVESIATTPNPDGPGSLLWLSVQRRINGTTVRYVEIIKNEFRGNAFVATTPQQYMDSFIQSSPGGTSVTGLTHLEGETVQVFADNFFVGTKTVASGAITLDESATDVTVGLGYEADIETIPMEEGATTIGGLGLIKKIDRAHIRFFDTIGAKYGPRAADLDDINFRPTDIAMEDDLPPFTGIKTVLFQGGPSNEAKILIRSDTPHPCGISSVSLRAEVYEG